MNSFILEGRNLCGTREERERAQLPMGWVCLGTTRENIGTAKEGPFCPLVTVHFKQGSWKALEGLELQKG